MSKPQSHGAEREFDILVALHRALQRQRRPSWYTDKSTDALEDQLDPARRARREPRMEAEFQPRFETARDRTNG